MKIIAMVTIHSQPPIDTPARIFTKAKQFSPQDKLLVLQEWIEKIINDRHEIVTKIELDIER